MRLRKVHGVDVARDEEQSVTPTLIERVLQLRFSSWQSEIVRKYETGTLERVLINVGHKIGKRELMRSLYPEPDQGKWVIHGPNR